MSDLSIAEQQKLDLAHEKLKVVEKKLRAVRKILNRDWEQMAPRDRSAQSRIVKELEQQRNALLETIEAFGPF